MFPFCTFEINEDPLITICFENLSGGPKFFVFQGRMIDSTKKSLSRFKIFLTSKMVVLGTTSNFRQGLLQNKFMIYSPLEVLRCYEQFENESILNFFTILRSYQFVSDSIFGRDRFRSHSSIFNENLFFC